jgi:signal transduction histidine kinase
LITKALAAGLGYYLASLVGLSLRLPSVTPSILWPPNAVLTSALILTRPRDWPAIILATLPAHLATQLPTGWPLPMILSFFATNCSEALVAAVGLRLLGDHSTRFDTFRRFGAFLCAAVLLAPLISTFADAAVGWWFRGDSYWLVWRARLSSSVLAQLTITPAIVGALTGVAAGVHRVRLARSGEAAALGLCLVVSGWLAFGGWAGFTGLRGQTIDAPLVLQLPFVLWAALRFGPVGTALALLVMTCNAAWGIVHGRGSVELLQPDQSVFTTQAFLIVVAVTLLGLATLIEERRLSMHALAERLQFETLLSEWSRTFVQTPSDRMRVVAEHWLGRIGSLMRVDCVRVFQFVVPTDAGVAVLAEWRRPALPPAPPLALQQDLPWIFGRILSHASVILPELDALPVEAVRDRSSLRTQGSNAVLFIPMLAGDRLVGALAFGTVANRVWQNELVTYVRLMSEVLANVLARRQTDDALRASEVMKFAILDSLTSGVAVIDAKACLLDVNENWTTLVEESRVMRYLHLRQGDNLQKVSPPEVIHGIKAVLAGTKKRFALEYASVEQPGTRWWQLVGVRLNRPEGGAVLIVSEITEQRRAEMEAQQSRQELAHFGRLSTVGELTASLAHELSQPLTGIMCNAQAAQRLLARRITDRGGLDDAMSDIVSDARRASEVIQDLRQLLRKGESQMMDVDLSAAILDVAKLLNGDAIIRNIVVTVDLASGPTIVWGNRVQLQQVLLNLMVNAFDAVGDKHGERAVDVSSYRADQREVTVTVRDSGVGLPVGTEDLVFNPFYTNKPHGMGLGLSIARSIVEAHGGSIRARGGGTNGTVFEFSLPLADLQALDDSSLPLSPAEAPVRRT